jgi:hypothetical protein
VREERRLRLKKLSVILKRMEFSDEELAFLRHARFGELPARVSPDDRVELIEVDPRRDRPEPDPDPYGIIPPGG